MAQQVGGFGYAADLIERFPATVGGVIHTSGLVIGPTPSALLTAYRTEQERVLTEIGDAPISEIPGVAAWRRVFRDFGVDPTKYRSAVEALLRRLIKQGEIPSTNTLVDMANLVSIRHRVPVAVFDQSKVSGVTRVGFAEGTERFTDLGSDEEGHPEPGEVIFVDDNGLVSARRWCWRQSAQSAAGQRTTEVVITAEGHHDRATEDVARAIDDLLGLIASHQPDALSVSTILDAGNTVLDF